MDDLSPRESGRTPGRRSLGLAASLIALLAMAVAFEALTPWRPTVVIAAAAAIAGIVAWAMAPKLRTPLLLLALLTWAGGESRLDLPLLWQNRDRASEYVFGRKLEDGEIASLREQAERLVSMRLRFDAEEAVSAELGLTRERPRPPDFAQRVDERVGAMQREISLEQWSARVEREYDRLAGDKRGGYFPPETDPEKVRGYLDALLETIAIAVWGTILAVALAAPASVLAARRSLEILAPGGSLWRRGLRRVGMFLGRRGFDACRGFNEFVLALIFVAILGLGPFAGVLALAVHTFGVLGKVFSDAIESVRTGEIDGVASTGAGPLQTVSFAIVPQIMPIVVSQSLLRFESNVRSASVLGLVGAGGIGFLIDAKLKAYEFREVATMMILIIIAVSLIDLACSRIMKKVL